MKFGTLILKKVIFIEQRDIILTSFPFSNLEGEKVRPSIIISNNDYNKKFDDILVVPLTTNLDVRDYVVLLTNRDLEKGKLLKDSKIKVDRIFSIDKKFIKLIIGRINREKFNSIKEIIYKLID